MALKRRELSDADEEWLAWIGKCVCIKGVKCGTLCFYGQTQFAAGQWCGVELDEPIGKNDGTVAGVRYFYCKQQHGIFAPASKVEKVIVASPKHHQLPDIVPARNKNSQVPKKRNGGNAVPNLKEEFALDIDDPKILSRTSRSRSLNYTSKIPHPSYLARKENDFVKLHHWQQGTAFANSISRPPIGGHISLEGKIQSVIPELESNDSSTFSSLFTSYDLNLTTYENNLRIFDKLIQDLSVDILAVTDNSPIVDDLEIFPLRSISCDRIHIAADSCDVLDSTPRCLKSRFIDQQSNKSPKPIHLEFSHISPCRGPEANSDVLFPLPKNLFPEETSLLNSEIDTIAQTNCKEVDVHKHQLSNRTISENYSSNKFYQKNSSLCRFASLPSLDCDSSPILSESVRIALTKVYSAPSLFHWVHKPEGNKLEDLNASIYDSLEGANLNSSFRRDCSEDEDKMTSSKERPASTYTVSSTDTGYQEELGGLTEDSTPVDGPELPFGRLADDLSRRLASRAEEFFQGMNDSGGFSMMEGERESERAPCPLTTEAAGGAPEETTVGSASPQSTISTTLTLEDVRETGRKDAAVSQSTSKPPPRPRPLKDTVNKPVTIREKSRAGRQSVVSAAPSSVRTKPPCKEEDGKENKPIASKPPSQRPADDPRMARLKPTGPPPTPRGALVKARDVPKPPRPSIQTKLKLSAPPPKENDVRRQQHPTPNVRRPPCTGAPAPVASRVKPTPRPAPPLRQPVPKQPTPAASRPLALRAARPTATLQAKPAPRVGPPRPAVTITDFKRPPLWMSKADLSREIQNLEAQCEARTKQLRVVKSQLHQATQGFDAFAILINYLTDDLDAFSNPRLLRDIQEAQEKLLASNLQIAYHKKELEELKKRNEGELQNVNQMLELSHKNEIKNIKERHTEQMRSMQLQHQAEITALKEAQKNILQESDVRFQKILDQINREHQTSLQGMEQSHQGALEYASSSYQQRQQELQEQLEEVQKQYDSLQSQVQKAELVLQKGIDSKIQWINAKRTDLEQEVESLQAVLEMKQGEICRLRSENNEMKKELEDLPILKEKIKKLKAREEDLVALVEEKNKLQRQMSQEHQETVTSYQRESQVSKRLALENEELQWRLRCVESSLMSSPDSPSLRKSSFSREDNSVDVFVADQQALEEDQSLCHVTWTIPAEAPECPKVKKRSHSFSGQTAATQRLYHARYKCRVSSPDPPSPLQSIAEDGRTPPSSSSGEDSPPSSSRDSPPEAPACFYRGLGSPRSQAGEAMVQQDETSLSLSHLVVSEDTSGRLCRGKHQRLERLCLEETSSLDLAMNNSTDTDISWEDDKADF